ncbi:MAG: DUF4097 family beta strand repeat-containing protein [Eubacteriales bacterium]
MKTAKKVAIIAASALIAVGLLISFGAIIAMDFDFSGMNTITPVTNAYSVKESFTNINIEGAECDIRLLASDDGLCKVLCSESDKISHSVEVNNKALFIKRTDNRKWYEHIGVYWGKMEIAVYLPQSDYEYLYVKSLSGNIEIPEGFSFVEADIHNTSGDIFFSANTENDLSVKNVSGKLSVSNSSPIRLDAESTSGNVTISSVKSAAELSVKTVSGDIGLRDIECKDIYAESTSGDVAFSDVYASEKIRIGNVSGQIGLYGCDASSLWINTTSGDVSGTLLTEKIFIAESVSGNISVPYSGTGGKCEIKTTSGNIKITLKQ